MTPSARCQAAIELLDEIDASNAPADVIFNGYFRIRRYAGGGDRRAVRALVYGVLRKRGQADWWCDRLKLAQISRTRALVCLASDRSPWPNIDAAAAFQGGRFGAACLSDAEVRAARQLADQEFDHAEQPPRVRGNVPDWLEHSFCTEINDNFEYEINALEAEAETDLRVNTLRATRGDVMRDLEAEGFSCSATPLAPQGIRLAQRRPLGKLRAFRDGHFEPQGEASQLAVELIGAEAGWRALDLCAGAGGKSLAIAARMRNQGRIRLCDVDPAKLRRAEVRLARAGVTIADQVPFDGTKELEIAEIGDNYDIVIIDAPCSGSGVWRRNPETKWRLTAEALKHHTSRQRELLRSATRLVRPGGTIVYMTCSILEVENRMMIDGFLAENDGAFLRRPLAEDWLRVTGQPLDQAVPDLQLTPGTHGMDGFYIAVLDGTAS